MTFDELLKAWDWETIPNCPGRYVLRGAACNLSPQEIVGADVGAKEFRVKTAKDAVLVVGLDDGGLISYRRQDGSFRHTLNTPEGFERKLAQLGIDLAG